MTKITKNYLRGGGIKTPRKMNPEDGGSKLDISRIASKSDGKIENVSGVVIDEEFADKQASPISLNGVVLEPIPGMIYPGNYWRGIWMVHHGHIALEDLLRAFALDDLWFLMFFFLRIPVNNRFMIETVKEFRDGPKTNTLDIWAREHFKSSLVTITETIQDLLKDPEERIVILSYTKACALSFLLAIKQALEQCAILQKLFPHVLFEDRKDAFKWGEQGICVRRKSFAKEMTVEAYGLIEGMPTGRHFTKMKYDDIVTADLVESPEVMQRIKDRFDLSLNLGVKGYSKRIVGTYYHHDDPLVYIANKKNLDGTPMYHLRVKPATDDGTPEGKSVLLEEEHLAELRAGNPYQFNCQQLCDPTPISMATFDSGLLVRVPAQKVPKKLFKFMVIDGAGDKRGGGRGDWWAINVYGVKPYRDDVGFSEVYWIGARGGEMTLNEAFEAIVELYIASGRILVLGVEKVGMSSHEVHIMNSLRAQGRIVDEETGTLKILKPGKRSKSRRIESALGVPLTNGKLHISTDIEERFVVRLNEEMRRFPYWHDDELDAWSYLYDILRDYRFGKEPGERGNDGGFDDGPWAKFRRYDRPKKSWMTA